MPAFPTHYSQGRLGSIPGADWFIDGQRYRETGREATETGERLTLVRVDVDPALGYPSLKES